MIPRPSIRPDSFDRVSSPVQDDEHAGKTSGIVDANLPAPDYPRDRVPTNKPQERSTELIKIPGYYDYYPMYGITPSAVPPYGYYSYGPVVAPPGHIYDPYAFWDRYIHHPVNQNIYNIPPGARFETIPQGSPSQDRLQTFEVESITGEGVPYSVRNVSSGNRFIVEYPSTTVHPEPAPAPMYRYHHGANSERAVHSPKFPRVSHFASASEPAPAAAQQKEPTESSSSYTEGSIHTSSGPHFMNGVDYLDVSTRSRILSWLNNSNSRPLRLRPISKERTAHPEAPLHYRIHTLNLR